MTPPSVTRRGWAIWCEARTAEREVMSRFTALRHAKRDHQESAERLMAATAVAFPLGMRLAVKLGRARVIGEVTGHASCWWHNPDYIAIRNENTGKFRWFCATLDEHQIETL